MEKIVDIFGHNKEFCEEYRKDNSWFGRILLGEDGCFEGVVEDYHQTDYYLVFGYATRESLIVTKCSKKDKDVPYKYEGFRENRKFEGSFAAKNPYVEIPLGECSISLLPAEATREESDSETQELKIRIAKLKHNLGEIGNYLHEDFEVSRIKTQSLVKKYQSK